MPQALSGVTFTAPVSSTPYWLAKGSNPFAGYPWRDQPSARLLETADTVVIGAGFTGASVAYFWARRAALGKTLVILEMNDPATGASGRNAGTVVMGRHFGLVHRKLLNYWRQKRPGSTEAELDLQARRFAAAYVAAACKNADLIERTIAEEHFDCDYHREGWVQVQEADQQAWLDESVRLAAEAGATDWTRISSAEVQAKCGLHTEFNAGYSRGAATFDPARWVWSLLSVAVRAPQVELFSRTRVLRVISAGPHYEVVTTRGTIRAAHVVNATESYTPRLHHQFHGLIKPIQSQAAFATGGPPSIKPHVAISSGTGFYDRHPTGVLFGSDETPVPDRCAGQNRPSRFITRFVLGEIRQRFGPFSAALTHEWSGTVGFTPDEYPVIGLIDGRGQYIIGGMCGSGTGVSFNAGRCLVNRILGQKDEPDDYPPEFFAPSRLLDPRNHPWPTAGPIYL